MLGVVQVAYLSPSSFLVVGQGTGAVYLLQTPTLRNSSTPGMTSNQVPEPCRSCPIPPPLLPIPFPPPPGC